MVMFASYCVSAAPPRPLRDPAKNSSDLLRLGKYKHVARLNREYPQRSAKRNGRRLAAARRGLVARGVTDELLRSKRVRRIQRRVHLRRRGMFPLKMRQLTGQRRRGHVT